MHDDVSPNLVEREIEIRERPADVVRGYAHGLGAGFAMMILMGLGGMTRLVISLAEGEAPDGIVLVLALTPLVVLSGIVVRARHARVYRLRLTPTHLEVTQAGASLRIAWNSVKRVFERAGVLTIHGEGGNIAVPWHRLEPALREAFEGYLQAHASRAERTRKRALIPFIVLGLLVLFALLYNVVEQR